MNTITNDEDIEPSLHSSASLSSDDVVTTAVALEDGVDIEVGTPVIELPEAKSVERTPTPEIPLQQQEDDSIEAAAVLDPPSGRMTIEDIESSPIAHLVLDHQRGGDTDSQSSPVTGDDNDPTTTCLSDANRALPLWERRAEFISSTIIKSSESDPVGLGLVCKNEEVLISSIAPGSLAENTPFRVGDRMLSVNAKRCYVMDSKSVAQFMASQVGRVTIVVHNGGGDPNLVESMITKPTLESRCGLGLVSTGRSKLKITNIERDGLFFDSLLNVGDLILSINGEDCTSADAQDAGDIIDQAGKYITIKARTLLETGVVVAAFSCNNSTGSTIPPQLINALNEPERLRPSNTQLVSLTLAAIFLIAFLLAAGFL